MTREQLQTISDLVAIAHDEYDGCQSYRDDLERYDRVLAEIKAEAQSAPGDAAAMREALEQALAYCESDQKSGIAYSDNDVLVPMLRAALAAPARNCDRFADCNTAWKAYNAITARERLPGFDFWLFDTVKGGTGRAAR